MNRKSILALLVKALGSIDVHPKLIEELIKIIIGSGYEARFLKLLGARLEFLSRHGVDSVKHLEFELIHSGVFSMHLAQGDFNIRILYSFFPDGTPTLLLCFYEREGKSRTNYTPYIDPAKARFKERLEAYENEE